ncbi:MAG: prolipoprotein diacylglyceryl transferase, partial [Candidatus Binatia bacterium]
LGTPDMEHFVWNVSPEIFRLGPFRVHWYGLFFALGFAVGYQIMVQFYRREGRPLENLSSLLLYMLLGTVVGARLGHVFLYEPGYYLSRPWEIPMIWRGGLASHGGFAGVMIAIYLYVRRYRDLSFLELADRLAIPALLVAAMIRTGNLFNSEILGTPSEAPWAVVFARVDNVPRHPAMLYEAGVYFLIFCALYIAYWKTTIVQFPGRIFGTVLATCFSLRFLIEFVKENQVPFEQALPLNMGQLLSIPFILAGFFLIYRSSKISPSEEGKAPGRARKRARSR